MKLGFRVNLDKSVSPLEVVPVDEKTREPVENVYYCSLRRGRGGVPFMTVIVKLGDNQNDTAGRP
jgi:hypothetical protein